MSDLLGKTLRKYQIIDQLGQGAMGAVFRAHHTALDRQVAIKVMLSDLADDADFLDRFEREATAIARLRHPNIVQVYDFDELDGLYYMVLEFIDGPTLKDELSARQAKGQPFTLVEVAQIFTALGNAIDYANSQGIIHRDLKPANVMFTGQGQVIVTDFGIAHIMGAKQEGTAGMITGTAAYMSPEQAQGDTVDSRSDIYSLGIILYELVAGRVPFTADNPLTTILQHITEDAPPPTTFNAQLSETVEQIILKTLSKNPADRYQTAMNLAEALGEAAQVTAEQMLAALPVTPVVSLTHQTAAQRSAVPSTLTETLSKPPEPSRPPDISEFVGRSTELDHYKHQLTTSHLAVITGMPGVGKTSLAAALAYQQAESDQIFWHSFRAGQGVSLVIWKLAGFLAWHGQEDLWRMLQSAQETGAQLPPAELLFDYVLQGLRNQSYLLCLDDFHLVADDPDLEALMSRMLRLVEGKEIALLITSRRIPDFVQAAEMTPLTGLTVADTRHLLQARGLSLSPQQADYLYAHTEGNAEFLTLAINALAQVQHPDRLLKRLAEADDIERYLLKEVDEGLTEDERDILSAVAALLGYPGTRDIIEALLEGGRIRRPLRDLSDRFLLLVNEGEWDKEYSEHSILRSFYYDRFSRRERREMHRLAGEYYEVEEPDPLKAALHYEQAGLYERAAELATANVWTLINQGQARPLLHLLEQFTAQQLETGPWVKVNIARGEIHTLQGQSRPAQESFQQALSNLATLPDSPTAGELKARAYQGMGDALRYDAPQEALDWLRRGIQELEAEANPPMEAALRIKTGLVQINVGDFSNARRSLEQGLELLPEGPSQLRATALLNIGNVHYYQGDPQQGYQFTQEALQISEQLYDYFQMVAILNNLGIDHYLAGEWDQAGAKFKQGLTLAEKLGDVKRQTELELSLGTIYTLQGDYEAADQHLAGCLALALAHNLKIHLVSVKSNLADLHFRLGDLEAVKPLLTEAEQLALEIAMKDRLPEIYNRWAQLSLAMSQAEEALDYAERSVNLARELEMELEEGMSLRVLGQACLANDRPEPALTAFEQSLAFLAGQDPYEAARTKLAWGRYLATGGHLVEGKRLLQEAQATFAQLGAREELAAIDEILAAESNKKPD